MTLGRRLDDFDEDDVRVRPGRRGSRPRTRRRPAHEEAVTGLVLAVDRGRYRCLVGDRTLTAMRARELGRKGVVVGDQVSLVGDTSGETDTLARIVRVQPRSSSLRRTADDTDPFERIIVANADQLVIVTALAHPQPRPRMIDRCLVAAYDAGLDPLLCLTKADLAAPDELVAAYEPLGVPYVVTRRDGALDELRARLAGRMSVLVGHSGVGKSTLVNALVPDAARAVSHVNPVTGRGRHTSSSAIALPLPPVEHAGEDARTSAAGISTPSTPGDSARTSEAGWIIDTPGIRSFGLAHVHPADLVGAFPDLAEGAVECPRACTHLQPDCALAAWVAAGHADEARLDSLRRLLESREGEAD